MTPLELVDALDALHWLPGRLALILGCSRDLPRKWLSGRTKVPPRVAEWLRLMADYARTHPAPREWRTPSKE